MSDPQFKFVKLLVPFNTGTVNDVSTNALVPTINGSVTIDATIKKYGVNSGLFNTGSLTFDSPTFATAANTNCAFEGWFRTTALGTEQYIFDNRDSSGNGGVAVSVSPTGQLTYTIAGNAGTVTTTTTAAVLVTINVWHYVMIRRVLSSNTAYTTEVFLNGVFATGLSSSLSPGLPATIMTSTSIKIGARFDSLMTFVGNIDELRFTIGHSRGSGTSNRVAIPINSFATLGTNTISAAMQTPLKFNAVNAVGNHGYHSVVSPLTGQPQYRISGDIKINGATTTSLKQVSLYRQSSGVLLQRISATANYLFFGLNPTEKYTVIVSDLTGNMRAVVQDNVYPSLNFAIPS